MIILVVSIGEFTPEVLLQAHIHQDYDMAGSCTGLLIDSRHVRRRSSRSGSSSVQVEFTMQNTSGLMSPDIQL